MMKRRDMIFLTAAAGASAALAFVPTPAGVSPQVAAVLDKSNLSIRDILSKSGLVDSSTTYIPQSSSMMRRGVARPEVYLQQFGVIHEGELSQRVQGIFANLVKSLPQVKELNGVITDLPWEVFMTQRKSLFDGQYLGNGKIHIYAGFIVDENLSDDEIAFLLAHEIGHSLFFRLPLGVRVLPIIPGTQVGIPYRDITLESPESEADLIGMLIMYAAGYDVTGAVSLGHKGLEKSKKIDTSQLGDRKFDMNQLVKNREQLHLYLVGRK